MARYTSALRVAHDRTEIELSLTRWEQVQILRQGGLVVVLLQTGRQHASNGDRAGRLAPDGDLRWITTQCSSKGLNEGECSERIFNTVVAIHAKLG